mgnify:CR=1 FL=1
MPSSRPCCSRRFWCTSHFQASSWSTSTARCRMTGPLPWMLVRSSGHCRSKLVLKGTVLLFNWDYTMSNLFEMQPIQRQDSRHHPAPYQQCYEGDHLTYLPMAVAAMLVFISGVPLITLFVLLRAKRHGLQAKLSLARCAEMGLLWIDIWMVKSLSNSLWII